jgi:hypothetical protein
MKINNNLYNLKKKIFFLIESFSKLFIQILILLILFIRIFNKSKNDIFSLKFFFFLNSKIYLFSFLSNSIKEF